MFTQTSRLSCTRPVTTLPHPPSASIPAHFGRCRSFHAQPNPLGPAPTGRGDAQTVRAGAATWDLTEWQMYQRESNFHARTLQLMHRITQTFKQEWDLYRAEWTASDTRSHMAAVLTPAAAASVELESFNEELRPGGYHPVQVGERFCDGRYTVLHYLGQGHYSTVWMVLDEDTGRECAMKVVRSAENYTEAARDELTLLQRIRDNDPNGAKHCVRLLDQFEHRGPNGLHVCEVFEAMGDDLLALIRVYEHRGIPLGVVRHLTRQTLIALDYLHTQCDIIHLDIKPENVLLTEPIRPRARGPASELTSAYPYQPPEVDLRELEPRLQRMGCKLVDFGNAAWGSAHCADEVQTRQYRAPEVILGAGYHDAADMWSLACMVFELVTGDFLFHPKSEGAYSKDEDHLAQMMELMGEMPVRIATHGKHAPRFFDDAGRLRHIAELHPWPLDRVLAEKYGLPVEEAEALRDFLEPMLCFDPAQRASAEEMLQHPWLTEGARGGVATGRGEEQAREEQTRSPTPMPPADYRHHSPSRQHSPGRWGAMMRH